MTTKTKPNQNGLVAKEQAAPITAEFLESEIERLTAELETFIAGANRQTAAYEGAIQFARQMLAKVNDQGEAVKE